MIKITFQDKIYLPNFTRKHLQWSLVFIKVTCWNLYQNSQEGTCALVSFLIKFQVGDTTSTPSRWYVSLIYSQFYYCTSYTKSKPSATFTQCLLTDKWKPRQVFAFYQYHSKFWELWWWSAKRPLKIKREKALRSKCPYSELFWSVFSRIWTEYGEIGYRITHNTDTFYTVRIFAQSRQSRWISIPDLELEQALF